MVNYAKSACAAFAQISAEQMVDCDWSKQSKKLQFVISDPIKSHVTSIPFYNYDVT